MTAFKHGFLGFPKPAGLFPGQGLAPLRTMIASQHAALDFVNDITDEFDSYLLTMEMIAPVTDNVNLVARVSNNNGATFQAGTEYYYGRVDNDTAAAGTVTGVGAGAISLFSLASNIGNALGRSVSGWLWFTRHANASFFCCYSTVWLTTGGSVEQGHGGAFAGVSGMNGLRLTMDSGVIASGIARLYGMKKP